MSFKFYDLGIHVIQHKSNYPKVLFLYETQRQEIDYPAFKHACFFLACQKSLQFSFCRSHGAEKKKLIMTKHKNIEVV